MKRHLLMTASVLLACCGTIADGLDDYVAFAKTEFKFEFCGLDDSVKPTRFPISQKYVENQFLSKYDKVDLRRRQYEHLAQFESSITNRSSYLFALSNLVEDVRFVAVNKGKDPGYKANYAFLIRMVEMSVARINESNCDIYVEPKDIVWLLPARLFDNPVGNVSAMNRYAMMRDLLVIGGHIRSYRKMKGDLPSSVADMRIPDDHVCRASQIKYVRQGDSWQLVASPKNFKFDVKLIEFDKYVPLVVGLPERFWKFDNLIVLSSNFSRKRIELYKGAVLNDGTPWACRMEGGKVVPDRHSAQIPLAGPMS